MKIIDAHVHVVERFAGFGKKGEMRPIGGGKVRWADGTEAQLIPAELGDKEFTGSTLVRLMDEHQVEKAVLLQGIFCGFQNDYAYETAQAFPGRFAVAGTLDPFCNESEAILDRLLTTRQVKILKLEVSSGAGLMSYHPRFPIDGPPLEALYERMSKQEVTVALDLGSPGMPSFQPEAVARIARRFPGLRIVLCHLLAPRLDDGSALTSALKTLRLDNVWFDLSAIPWNIQPEIHPYPTGVGFVRLARKLVGYRKLLWGSDVPCVLTRETYARLRDYLITARIFHDNELEPVYRTNALVAYPELLKGV